jgi:DNA polymerase alpha subunit A
VVFRLQGRCVELKEELRNLLLDRNIADFSMVPVKRSYGFEREDVARCEQWVIKLRVPAASPPLPSDLSGRQFTCLFGTNTSPLEALLLKRKVMGPSWLLLNKPGGVSCQLSWCKTECTVSGHKVCVGNIPNPK